MRQSAAEESWVRDFAVDIHSHLRKREKDRLPIYGSSKQLHLRPHIFELLSNICNQKMFCTPSQHLAAYFLDAFLDGNHIEEEHLQLFVLGCLSVAVKLEENGDLIPSNRDLCKFLDSMYIPLDIMHAEITTLEYFEFDVLLPTAAHFAEYYELYATIPLVDGLSLERSNYELLKSCINRYIDYFLDVVLQDMKFYNYNPSMVASACVASSRIQLMLIPAWPFRLRDITQYELKELQPCIRMLTSQLHKDMKKYKIGQGKSLKQSLHKISCLFKREKNISHS